MDRVADKKYNEVLNELMFDEDKLDQFIDELKFISDEVKKEPQFQIILAHPEISKEDKKDMITSVFEESVSKSVMTLCYNLIDKGMENYFNRVGKDFDDKVNDKYGIIEAVAYTVLPISVDSMEKLKEILTKKLKKRVILSNKVDKSIVGGVVLKVGDKLIDGSIKGRIGDIHTSLNNSIIKL
ncbi:ATP synthase F1 subunit delta [uncultured Clostridium sp.]|uniref:ATP synthase F1 subunit delta n=1 Tax=uncultured Clostridium sp. TaxID=59620 RepID=UPI0028F12BE3|nr:ATP synthase F1 subunit delta [uncultured Clostridium sp.]